MVNGCWLALMVFSFHVSQLTMRRVELCRHRYVVGDAGLGDERRVRTGNHVPYTLRVYTVVGRSVV